MCSMSCRDKVAPALQTHLRGYSEIASHYRHGLNEKVILHPRARNPNSLPECCLGSDRLEFSTGTWYGVHT